MDDISRREIIKKTGFAFGMATFINPSFANDYSNVVIIEGSNSYNIAGVTVNSSTAAYEMVFDINSAPSDPSVGAATSNVVAPGGGGYSDTVVYVTGPSITFDFESTMPKHPNDAKSWWRSLWPWW